MKKMRLQDFWAICSEYLSPCFVVALCSSCISSMWNVIFGAPSFLVRTRHPIIDNSWKIVSLNHMNLYSQTHCYSQISLRLKWKKKKKEERKSAGMIYTQPECQGCCAFWLISLMIWPSKWVMMRWITDDSDLSLWP